MSEKPFYGSEFFSYICQLAQFLCHILCIQIIHTGHMRPCIVKLFPTVISASSFGSEDCLRWRNRRTDRQVVASLASFTYLDSHKSAPSPPQEANITSTRASSPLFPCSVQSDTTRYRAGFVNTFLTVPLA